MGSKEIWKLEFRQSFVFIGKAKDLVRRAEVDEDDHVLEKRALLKADLVSVTQIINIRENRANREKVGTAAPVYDFENLPDID